ncbi:efflux RND transporter permease subunit [Desulfovibrio ferrophilus]|nr:efflux RND transporter permease subunit [Desulfovibrio ferrophilus]
MDIIRSSIDKPVTVLVGIILIVLFGLIGLFGLPYQLTPSVTEPEITVTTTWSGATPYEIERDIIEEQEDVLKGIPGLKEMDSTSKNSSGELTLKFKIGTDSDDALLRVSNKLNEVPSYPATADKPVITATGSAASPVIWIVLKALPDNKRPIASYKTLFEDRVRQHLERVEGVADLFIGGGTEQEMHVIVDPAKLAAHGLTIPDLIGVLQTENINISAGNMSLGSHEYRIRSVGEFKSPEQIEAVVIRSTGQQRVTVADVGRAEFGFERPVSAMMHNNEPGIAIGVKPETGANILEMTDRVHEVVKELNSGMLKENGIRMDWTYDQRPYINGAIGLVQQNIIVGSILAVTILIIFLRSLSSTIIVAVAIPISIIGTFIFMSLFGRNLNVVSLAGISFAVGMLVDNAIVVLENIDRHRKQLGKRAAQAAYDGTREVWGAVLASTLTTVAVFLPVVFIEEEAGQLFKDIAIAVTCAVSISMIVSISVIPMFAKQLFSLAERRKNGKEFELRILKPLTGLGTRISNSVMGLVQTCLKSTGTRLATILLLTGLAVGSSWLFMPKMEYLPQGNRNMLLSVLIPPPGMSVNERTDWGNRIFGMADPFLGQDEVNGLPGIRNLFYVGTPGFNIFGVISSQEQRARELLGPMMGWSNSIPGVFGFSFQAGIFQNQIGGDRTIDVDLIGSDLPTMAAAAQTLFLTIPKAMAGAQVRPVPSFEMTFPEIRLAPYRDRLKATGLTSQDLGISTDVLMDGRKVGDFKEEGQPSIDLVLMASEQKISTPEDLYGALLSTPDGRLLPISSLAGLTRTTGINEIRHLERNRTFTLQVTPPETMPLEEAMELIQDSIIPDLEAKGALQGMKTQLSGAADKLTVTRQALQWNFILAVVIIYLLMSSLFGNFFYPLIILFTVPLAAAGGFIGLKLENLLLTTQPLDVLTMLGFVILIGVVVNNAILIVHQSLNNIREGGMDHKEAVLESVRTRLRPIYMSAMTSIFGMLPLAVWPGPGSELYRGLGAVILGGLALSTVFTVFVIPSLLMFFIGMEKKGTPSTATQT